MTKNEKKIELLDCEKVSIMDLIDGIHDLDESVGLSKETMSDIHEKAQKRMKEIDIAIKKLQS